MKVAPVDSEDEGSKLSIKLRVILVHTVLDARVLKGAVEDLGLKMNGAGANHLSEAICRILASSQSLTRC